MHNAPAVSYPVGRSHFQAVLYSGLLLLAVAGLVLWCLQADRLGWRQIVAGVAWLICVTWALREPMRRIEGSLHWDGQNWSWESRDAVLAGTLVARLDWQARVLVEFRSFEAKPLWFWLERATQPQRWDDLRRALWTVKS